MFFLPFPALVLFVFPWVMNTDVRRTSAQTPGPARRGEPGASGSPAARSRRRGSPPRAAGCRRGPEGLCRGSPCPCRALESGFDGCGEFSDGCDDLGELFDLYSRFLVGLELGSSGSRSLKGALALGGKKMLSGLMQGWYNEADTAKGTWWVHFTAQVPPDCSSREGAGDELTAWVTRRTPCF